MAGMHIRKLTAYLNQQSRLTLISLGILLVLLISVIDFLTKDFFVLEFYLIPIVLVTWFAGRNAGFIMALINGLATLSLDIIETYYHSSKFVHVWNFFMNFSFFLIVVCFLIRLKELMELKSKFVSTISHELRTPIAVIQEGVNIVREGLVGDINDKQRELLGAVRMNARRLARMINDILDFQKYESGKMKLSLEEADINKVVQEAYRGVELLVKEKGLDLILDMGKDLPRIEFDKDRIIQVIVNLLSNAIKFTEKGAITVSTAKDKNNIQVAVRDNGCGISSEDMPKIFRSFSQLKGADKHGVKGTGLGLAISKEIVVTHGGRIWAESEPGRGSTFYFTLPIGRI